MNFLAHCLLSGRDGDVLAGNLMADFLAPPFPTFAREGIQRGIERHYAIDRFMDSHPLVARSRMRLFPHYRHYSAVLVDVFYDHLLALYFERFCDEPLPEFARWVYGELQERHELLPSRMQEVVPRMIEGNWLVSYARPDGVRYALSRVQRRARRHDFLARSWNDFAREQALYEAEFFEFMPQVLRLCPASGDTRGE